MSRSVKVQRKNSLWCPRCKGLLVGVGGFRFDCPVCFRRWSIHLVKRHNVGDKEVMGVLT